MTPARLAAALLILALAACQPAPEPAPPPDMGGPVDRGPRQAVSLGETCGGMTGLYCADEGAFCQIPMEGICGAADATGTCVMPPEACTREYRPVCGCDGQTYSNACEAAAAGVSVASEGMCEG